MPLGWSWVVVRALFLNFSIDLIDFTCHLGQWYLIQLDLNPSSHWVNVWVAIIWLRHDLPLIPRPRADVSLKWLWFLMQWHKILRKSIENGRPSTTSPTQIVTIKGGHWGSKTCTIWDGLFLIILWLLSEGRLYEWIAIHRRCWGNLGWCFGSNLCITSICGYLTHTASEVVLGHVWSSVVNLRINLHGAHCVDTNAILYLINP
jgi:hypothetical protein